MVRRRSALTALFVTLTPVVAHAQASEVATARQLAISGIDLVESGDCAKGEPLLERAEQLHHASVHLQYLARCRATSGRLVAATEMWRQIIREGAPAAASPAVIGALNEATTKLAQVLPRLASTTIRTAAPYKGVVLTIDGVPLAAEIVGVPQVLDPGGHQLSARAPGFAGSLQQWTLAEGGTADIVIQLTPAPPGSAGGGGASNRTNRASDANQEGPPFAPIGWVTTSVGAASLVAGAVTLLSHNSRLNELQSACPQGVCKAPAYTTKPQFDSDTGTIRNLMTASNVLLFGGGALVAGGVILIVIGSTRSSKESGTAVAAGAPGADAGLTVLGHW